jgi:hypothetical protein
MWVHVDGNARGWGEGVRLVDEMQARDVMERANCDVAAFEQAGLVTQEG